MGNSKKPRQHFFLFPSSSKCLYIFVKTVIFTDMTDWMADNEDDCGKLSISNKFKNIIQTQLALHSTGKIIK